MVICRDNKGFTLVESVIALAVLSVGFLAVAGVMGGTMSGRTFSARLTSGTLLAQEKMEETLRVGYAGLPAVDSSSTEAYGDIPGYPEYSRTISVDVAHPDVGMKSVAVTVNWDSHRHAVCLNTIIAR
jgi:prepilin-type N-terminal cleavage/methylation domain-containing protein